MNNKRFLSMISITKKSGNLKYGSENAKSTILSGKANLIILSCDVSDRNKRLFSGLSEEFDVPIIFSEIIGFELGKAIGRDSVTVISVSDKNLASALIKLTEAQ